MVQGIAAGTVAMDIAAATAMGIAAAMAIVADSDSGLALTLGGLGDMAILMPMDIIRTTLPIHTILTPITMLQ